MIKSVDPRDSRAVRMRRSRRSPTSTGPSSSRSASTS